jgi:SAM-dependent methyltransferase
MSDPLSARYDAIPYRHGAIPHTHPARVGAIARLLGMSAASPDHCRVLELGCAEGMNLLPLAERLPHAQFTGVDISPKQIATAEAARDACGLGNARFVCADLRDFEPEASAFDYVIAHGVYSWVPDAVKDRLLAICARALAPEGVAYVSYNVLPGWGVLDGMRKFLLAETARESTPQAQLDHALRVLGVLGKCTAGQPGAYAALVREAVADMTRKSPALLFHDELGTVNDPCTFLDFTAHATRRGLHFLSEAHYASMPFEHVPAPIRDALGELDLDFLRAQQFMDVLYQRWLRSTLLCRAAPARELNPHVVRDCAIGLRLRPADGRVNLQPGVPMRMLGPNELTLDFDTSATKAFLAALAQAGTVRVAFPEVVENANRFLRQVGLPEIADDSALLAEVCRLFAVDAVDLVLTGNGAWLRTAEGAAPSPLMRYQAGENLPLANRWHEFIDLTAEGRRSLADPAQTPGEAALQQAGLLV